eukprot:6466676-Amphidinium_carterae.4
MGSQNGIHERSRCLNSAAQVHCLSSAWASLEEVGCCLGAQAGLKQLPEAIAQELEAVWALLHPQAVEHTFGLTRPTCHGICCCEATDLRLALKVVQDPKFALAHTLALYRAGKDLLAAAMEELTILDAEAAQEDELGKLLGASAGAEIKTVVAVVGKLCGFTRNLKEKTVPRMQALATQCEEVFSVAWLAVFVAATGSEVEAKVTVCSEIVETLMPLQPELTKRAMCRDMTDCRRQKKCAKFRNPWPELLKQAGQLLKSFVHFRAITKKSAEKWTKDDVVMLRLVDKSIVSLAPDLNIVVNSPTCLDQRLRAMFPKGWEQAAQVVEHAASQDTGLVLKKKLPVPLLTWRPGKEIEPVLKAIAAEFEDARVKIASVARSADDEIFLKELSYISIIMNYDAAYVAVASLPEPLQLTLETQPVYSELGHHLQVAQDHLKRHGADTVKGWFQPTDVDPAHCPVLDKVVKEAGIFLSNVTDLGQQRLAEMVTKVGDSLKAESASLQAMCMPGWEAQAHVLCDDECAELREKLLTNPSCGKLGAGIQALETLLAPVRKLQQERPAFPIEQVMESESVLQMACKTVAFTYTIFQLFKKIPLEPTTTGRRDAVKGA